MEGVEGVVVKRTKRDQVRNVSNVVSIMESHGGGRNINIKGQQRCGYT